VFNYDVNKKDHAGRDQVAYLPYAVKQQARNKAALENESGFGQNGPGLILIASWHSKPESRWLVNIVLVGLSLLLTVSDPPAGTELQYTGTVTRQTKDGETEVKNFSLHAVIINRNDKPHLAYHTEERGSGTWGWPERFGLLSIDDLTSNVVPIRLLQTHEEQQYPLPVRSPVFEFRDKLTPQTSWTDGRKEYVVTRKRTFKNRECLQVEVSSNIGRKQTLIVEADTGILVSLDEKIVLGRGDEFRMKMELQSQKQLDETDLAKSETTLESLIALHSQLARTSEQKAVELTPEQLKLVQTEVPRIEKEAQGTTWSRLVAAISRDLQQQQKRLTGVAGLEKKRIGQPAPDWQLKLTDGTSISNEDLKGKVVVFHLWQYRGEPLNEPYGQIGYLDFLNNKRKKLGVKVIGVNIDERFSDPAQTGVANRSMKKLLEFMNVSYDMAIDDGSVLAAFGDPRDFGAPLPLWIVIGHDGNVAHYHAGFYDIKPDEGLKQLEEAVIQAVRRQNAK
jgi:peroxiredoxin